MHVTSFTGKRTTNTTLLHSLMTGQVHTIYRILQIVRGGKVSWMDKVLQIRWKTFAVRSPWLKCAHDQP